MGRDPGPDAENSQMAIGFLLDTGTDPFVRPLLNKLMTKTTKHFPH